MIVQLAQPVGFSQIGKRSNNEDAIFPLCGDESSENRLFLVCDGMGGHSNGEIASHLTINRFAKYFELHFQQKRSLEEIADLWNHALIELEEEFEDYILQNPDSQGMGTTLCLLHFHDKGVTIGHIGDSRVYQISEGQVVFMTEDHSIVNELLKSGEITPSEALTYPNRNVITRAIQGTSLPTKIAFDFLDNIKAGDYFFMCTDGVLEQINDSILVDILNYEGASLKDKSVILLEKCLNLIKDNYSGYLVEVSKVEKDTLLPIPAFDKLQDEVETFEDKLEIEQATIAHSFPQKKYSKPKSAFIRRAKDVLMGLFYAFLGLILFFAFYIGFDYFKKDEKKKQSTNSETNFSTINIDTVAVSSSSKTEKKEIIEKPIVIDNKKAPTNKKTNKENAKKHDLNVVGVSATNKKTKKDSLKKYSQTVNHDIVPNAVNNGNESKIENPPPKVQINKVKHAKSSDRGGAKEQ